MRCCQSRRLVHVECFDTAITVDAAQVDGQCRAEPEGIENITTLDQWKNRIGKVVEP